MADQDDGDLIAGAHLFTQIGHRGFDVLPARAAVDTEIRLGTFRSKGFAVVDEQSDRFFAVAIILRQQIVQRHRPLPEARLDVIGSGRTGNDDGHLARAGDVAKVNVFVVVDDQRRG